MKAYLQKGSTLVALKEPAKASSAYTKALELDPNCQVGFYFKENKKKCFVCSFSNLKEAVEGYRQCSLDLDQNPEEIRKRAMQDPEVQAILNDPAMRMILGENFFNERQSDSK